ncbi:MAG TPA: hypothetical protein VF804_11635 [Holophagaceae bacterium]
MTWKPSPRPGVDRLALSLDAPQAQLLERLDGTLGLPDLAALLDLDEHKVAGMLEELVALGAIQPADPEAPESDEAAARAATHRARFEQQLHPQPLDARVAQARGAVEPDLSAFCFDPTAEVVRAVLENPKAGLLQARLIAAHHRTAAGLEALGARTAFTNDPGVRRGLLLNPLLPAGLYRRLWSPRRLLEQYLVATSRDAPEQVRAMARDLLRASFNQRTGEERAELILATEGRCLASLVGLTLDGHTTALLCRRTYVSTLLIQNIARWSAAPPPLIAHLRRQEAVKRNAPLRQLLERHPNAT